MSPRMLVFVLFTAAYFMSYFFRSANAVIAPDLAGDLGLRAEQLGLMTSLFFATFAAMQPPLGIWLDRYGSRWVTPLLMLVGVAGSLVFASASSFAALAIGRALIGVGMAGVLMGSLKMFSRWFPAAHYATVSGLLVGIGSLGALLAATPMAWLNAALGWRAIFVVGAGVTALIAVAIMLFTRNTPSGVSFRSPGDSNGSLTDVLRDRRIWRVLPATFFLAGFILGFQGLWAGPYLYDVQGMNDVQVGNVLLWLGVGATIGYTASGWLCDRFGLMRMTTIALVVFIVCQVALVFRPATLLLYPVFLALGIAGGFNVMLLALGRRLFPLEMTGKATTTINLFAIGGVFVLQWLMGVIIGRWPADAAGHYPPVAYSAALAVVAVGTLASLLWFLPLAQQGE